LSQPPVRGSWCRPARSQTLACGQRQLWGLLPIFISIGSSETHRVRVTQPCSLSACHEPGGPHHRPTSSADGGGHRPDGSTLLAVHRVEGADAQKRTALRDSVPDPSLRLEVLYIDGCTNVRDTVALVQHVVSDLHVDADLHLVEVADAADAVEHHFFGSPTVRVEGTDVEPSADERSDYAFACRLYQTETSLDTRPAEEWIRTAVRQT